jgi:hypothetical protein
MSIFGGTSITTTYGPEIQGPAAAAAAAAANANAFASQTPPPASQPPPSAPTGVSSATGNTHDSVGVSYVTDQKTAEKIAILRKKNPVLAEYVSKLLGMPNGNSKTAQKNLSQLDPHTRNLVITLFSAELSLHQGIATASSYAGSAIESAKNTIVGDIRGIKDSINQELQPVSSFVGSTLGTLTNVLQNPLGAPEAIGRAIGKMVDDSNPGFMDKLDATLKKYKVDELQHLPSQILGGIKSLASTLDAILSVPLALAADIYNGVMQLIQEMSDLLNSVTGAIMDLIFGPKGLLDSLVPIGPLLEFLSTVSEVVSIAGPILGSFSGLTAVTSVVGEIGSVSSLAQGALSNPLSLASAYLPPGASMAVGAFRNPQMLLSQLIPPSINQQLGKIGSLPGLGFVGNLGYSLGGTLQSLQGGIISNIVDQYTSQLGILGPLLHQQSTGNPVSNQSDPHPPSIQPAAANPTRPTVHGIVVDTAPAPLVLPQNNQFSSPLSLPSAIPNLNTPSEPFNYNTPPTIGPVAVPNN